MRLEAPAGKYTAVVGGDRMLSADEIAVGIDLSFDEKCGHKSALGGKYTGLARAGIRILRLCGPVSEASSKKQAARSNWRYTDARRLT